jgi:hypothetical protein
VSVLGAGDGSRIDNRNANVTSSSNTSGGDQRELDCWCTCNFCDRPQISCTEKIQCTQLADRWPKRVHNTGYGPCGWPTLPSQGHPESLRVVHGSLVIGGHRGSDALALCIVSILQDPRIDPRQNDGQHRQGDHQLKQAKTALVRGKGISAHHNLPAGLLGHGNRHGNRLSATASRHKAC